MQLQQLHILSKIKFNELYEVDINGYEVDGYIRGPNVWGEISNMNGFKLFTSPKAECT